MKTGQFDHVAQRARDDRNQEQARLAAREALIEQGVRVIEEDSIPEAQELAWLTDDQDNSEPLTPETHANCSGHAAYLEHRWIWPGDDTEDASDGGPYEWVPAWVCTSPIENGHHDRYSRSEAEQASAPTRVADMNDEERETARTARREVIDNNKAWESAQRVRRAWLKSFLTRKTCLLYTSPSPRDQRGSRMPSSA